MTKSRLHLPGGSASAPKSRPNPKNHARNHAPQDALALLLKVMTNANAPPLARIAAANALLAHGCGEVVRDKAAAHAQAALTALLDLMKDADATPRIRLAAATAILECGRSKPVTGLGTGPNRQSWLTEISDIRARFAAEPSALGRSGDTRTTAEPLRVESSSRRSE